MGHTPSSTMQAPTQFTETSAIDIASYFAKKKLSYPKKALFRFEASSHAISMTSYLREQRQGLYGSMGDLEQTNKLSSEVRHELVCAPSAKNITIIFSPLLKFVKEIEDGLGRQCALHEFVIDYVKNVFMGEVQCDIAQRAEAASSGKNICIPRKFLTTGIGEGPSHF